MSMWIFELAYLNRFWWVCVPEEILGDDRFDRNFCCPVSFFNKVHIGAKEDLSSITDSWMAWRLGQIHHTGGQRQIWTQKAFIWNRQLSWGILVWRSSTMKAAKLDNNHYLIGNPHKNISATCPYPDLDCWCWSAGTVCMAAQRTRSHLGKWQELCSQQPTHTVSHFQILSFLLELTAHERDLIKMNTQHSIQKFTIFFFLIYPNSSKKLLTFHWCSTDVREIQEKTWTWAVNLKKKMRYIFYFSL